MRRREGEGIRREENLLFRHENHSQQSLGLRTNMLRKKHIDHKEKNRNMYIDFYLELDGKSGLPD